MIDTDEVVAMAPSPGLERVRWLGRHVREQAERHPGLSGPIIARREAYQYIHAELEDLDRPKYAVYYAARLPGGLSLHLEALRRLADQELGNE